MSTATSNPPFHEDAIDISSVIFWKIGNTSKSLLREKIETLFIGLGLCAHQLDPGFEVASSTGAHISSDGRIR